MSGWPGRRTRRHQPLDCQRSGWLPRLRTPAGRCWTTPLTLALLLHRIALAAAWVEERREAAKALYGAERVVDRSEPEKEPDWLYWLGKPVLTAMTGRCLVVLGRPVRAVRLLADRKGGVGPRTAALYGTWLARGCLALGRSSRLARSQPRRCGSPRRRARRAR
jgi:hypothetical protein